MMMTQFFWEYPPPPGKKACTRKGKNSEIFKTKGGYKFDITQHFAEV